MKLYSLKLTLIFYLILITLTLLTLKKTFRKNKIKIKEEKEIYDPEDYVKSRKVVGVPSILPKIKMNENINEKKFFKHFVVKTNYKNSQDIIMAMKGKGFIYAMDLPPIVVEKDLCFGNGMCYRIEQMLAISDLGSVYKVSRNEGEEVYALKLNEFKDNIPYATHYLAVLNHIQHKQKKIGKDPTLVKIHEVEVFKNDKGDYVIASIADFVKGEDIEHYLKKNKTSTIPFITDLIECILEAMDKFQRIFRLTHFHLTTKNIKITSHKRPCVILDYDASLFPTNKQYLASVKELFPPALKNKKIKLREALPYFDQWSVGLIIQRLVFKFDGSEGDINKQEGLRLEIGKSTKESKRDKLALNAIRDLIDNFLVGEDTKRPNFYSALRKFRADLAEYRRSLKE